MENKVKLATVTHKQRLCKGVIGRVSKKEGLAVLAKAIQKEKANLLKKGRLC